MKKIIWFGTKLIQSGGGERLSLEVTKSLSKDYEVYYLAYHYKSEKVFNGLYDSIPIQYFSDNYPKTKFSNPFTKRIWLLKRRLWLRKKIKQIRPDLIITTGTWLQVSELYLSTLGLKINYIVHIFGSLFAFPPKRESMKYARIFKKNFLKIRNSVESYKEVVPVNNPENSIKKLLGNELNALIKYFAIRRAKAIYVLSERNKKETNLLYGKSANVLKGAFPKSIFDYLPKRAIKKELGLQDKKVILSVCRLSSNKRVDLIIKSFALIAKDNPDTYLVIGGTGSEEEYLKSIVKSKSLESQVQFIGFIPDEYLWDYMHGCDIFISLDLADFDIAPLEALALGSKIIWSEEIELQEIECKLPDLVFSVDTNLTNISHKLHQCINSSKVSQSSSDIKGTLIEYSWENYSKKMLQLIDY